MGEGRVFSALAPDRRSGSMVAVTCETDFVARTPDFDKLLADLAGHVERHAPVSVEAMLRQRFAPTGTSVAEALQATVGKLGENIQVARVQRLANPEGRVGTYVHHNQKVGVLVSVTTGASAEQAAEPLKLLCMHVAVMKPAFARRQDVTAEMLERERAIYLEEVTDKPADMREKIVRAKLEKFYADQVLGEQPWFKDDKLTVQKAISGMLGEGWRIEAFARFEVGG
jgi:elongation factor Ts